MILQALYEYYQRTAASGNNRAAPQGFQWKELPYIIVLDQSGNFLRLEDTQEKTGKKVKAKAFLVPLAPIRAGAVIRPGLLWDQLEYAIGANPRGRTDIVERFGSFRDRITKDLAAIDHPTLKALMKFLFNSPAEQMKAALRADEWEPIQAVNPFISFRLEGESIIPEVLFEQLKGICGQKANATNERFCPVSGGKGSVPLLHSKIKGVWGAQSVGATLVSFNLDPFESYRKTQNANAQMSDEGAEAYTKALNLLLSDGSENRLQIGDASTVFWSEKPTTFEKQYRSFFAMPSKDDPDKGISELRAAIESVRSGIPPEESSSRFYVLGLAPNSARIAVRFWHAGTVGEFAVNIKKHFDDIAIVTPSYDNGNQTLAYLLGATALEWKSENVPPNLAGNVMRAVMSGGPYPATLLQQCLRRIRAEQGDVNRARASILKACLNRRLHVSNQDQEKEITVALDQDNMNQGYRLGRLFAVLEKIQEDANPGLNATIRDRFYGAASSTPVSVFPQLLKLKNHHLSKLENVGLRVAHERRLSEIVGGLETSMSAHLSMDDQARFALGYYHQRQALFTSNKENHETK